MLNTTIESKTISTSVLRNRIQEAETDGHVNLNLLFTRYILTEKQWEFIFSRADLKFLEFHYLFSQHQKITPRIFARVIDRNFGFDTNFENFCGWLKAEPEKEALVLQLKKKILNDPTLFPTNKVSIYNQNFPEWSFKDIEISQLLDTGRVIRDLTENVFSYEQAQKNIKLLYDQGSFYSENLLTIKDANSLRVLIENPEYYRDYDQSLISNPNLTKLQREQIINSLLEKGWLKPEKYNRKELVNIYLSHPISKELIATLLIQHLQKATNLDSSYYDYSWQALVQFLYLIDATLISPLLTASRKEIREFANSLLQS